MTQPSAGLSSHSGRPNTAAVTASKTGLLDLTRPPAAEVGPDGIRVNMVVPGSMDTERRYPEWYPEHREAPANWADAFWVGRHHTMLAWRIDSISLGL
jgi:NAD(P)-dependent dehydrogenase (short-subunit alcohol dehydrogenase family)